MLEDVHDYVDEVDEDPARSGPPFDGDRADTVLRQQLVDRVNREGAVVVDVRDRKEYEAGHIAGAISIPLANLDTRADELRKYADKPIIVACKMGQHSGEAGMRLRKRGYQNVSRLAGGMAEWQNQNLPVVRK